MSGALLDTSVLIASDESGDLALPDAAAISVISLGELRAGVDRASGPVRRARSARLSAIRAAFTALAVDEPIAERYGELLAVARDQGRSEKATDLLVAATASVTDRTLYTLDRRQAAFCAAAGLDAHAL